MTELINTFKPNSKRTQNYFRIINNSVSDKGAKQIAFKAKLNTKF